jgi:hypothetical protein
MLSRDLVCWKTLWDIFISDEEFRKYYANVKGDYRITPGTKKPIQHPSGTLVLPGERSSGEDHFVTYNMTPQRITVFDPSDTSGTYGSYLNETARKKIATLAKKPLYVSHRHPQCHSGDTFCQTWSLAWLRRNLQSYINESRTPNSSIAPITALVKTIAQSNKFKQYMMSNKVQFQPIINKERRKKHLEPMSVEEFIYMSRHITQANIGDILGKHKS